MYANDILLAPRGRFGSTVQKKIEWVHKYAPQLLQKMGI